MEKSKIKYLAFEGGGIKIVGHCGAFEAIEREGIVPQLKEVHGVSAGAIIATMVSLGYTAKELKQLVFDLDFNTFLDGGTFEKVNVLHDYGLYKGNVFLKFIQDKIEAKTGSKYTTFAGLYAGGFKDLHIYAYDCNREEIKVFNYRNTPHYAVCDVNRWSMSIPVIFEAHTIPQDKTIYSDGGVQLNYPLARLPQDESIGVCFDFEKQSKDNGLKKGHFIKYLRANLNGLANSQATNIKENKELLSRSIVINTFGISSVDFDINTEEKQKLYGSGLNAADLFLK